MTTLFERDARFTEERIRSLRHIADVERCARGEAEPRSTNPFAASRHQWSLGPATLIALALALAFGA